MSIIDSIQLSGSSYDVRDKSATTVVSLTQQGYDALPSSAKTDTSKMYVITDAEAGDLTNYYTKTETNTLLGGKADTATTYTKTEVDNAITAATATKQDTLVSSENIKTINNISILGSGNIDIQGGGGGGKAVTGGTNISVTTGETADTINCTLPISYGGIWGHSINLGRSDNKLTSGDYNLVQGVGTEVKNNREMSCCSWNVSHEANNTFGDSGNTLFSVGNGTADNARHNAFEIRQNGDIYLSSGGTDIKLQDHLGGGGGGGVDVVQTTGTSTTDVMSQDAVTTQLNGKADKTTAARGLGYGNKNTHSVMHLTNQNGQEISGYYYTLSLSKINDKEIVKQGDVNPNTFSLVETSAITTSISSSSTDAQVPSAKAVNDKLGGLSLVKLTQAQYDALATKDSNTLYVIVN